MMEEARTLLEMKRLKSRGNDSHNTPKSSASGASPVDFPNGLPLPPPRKQTEKLSELEQQLKKSEAAQRRKLQVQKAARESEPEAIRKILGQDSDEVGRENEETSRRTGTGEVS
ncbi:hypothetical protein K1719_019094 [Acacia pycnantha]|nr:hypothetical protein K1719_019094 [Acacia pycnantha]